MTASIKPLALKYSRYGFRRIKANAAPGSWIVNFKLKVPAGLLSAL
ncbi:MULTISPECIES: hypothetical protein [unclassified Ensifer]|nr:MULTISPECIES: hypothetical protein [unclassified Ensifer]